MHHSQLAFALLLVAAPAAAQSLLYDAGVAGTPPIAPGPSVQGWSSSVSGSCVVGPLSPDPAGLLNAWQVHDTGQGEVRFAKSLTVPATSDYDVDLVMMPLAGTVTLEIDTGDLLNDSVFLLHFEVVGSDVHLDDGYHTLVCPDAADGRYHTFRFSGEAVFLDAEYDGVALGMVYDIASGNFAPGRGLRWGTFGTTVGSARFHRLEMTLRDWGDVGATYCSPAVVHSGGVGAHITAEGDPFDTLLDVRLRASDLPPHSFGFFLVSHTQGLVAQPGGSQGNLCLGGNIGRFVGPGQIQDTGALGRIWINVNPQSLPTSPISAVNYGETWSFQAWFRDANPGPTSNFTDGVAVLF